MFWNPHQTRLPEGAN